MIKHLICALLLLTSGSAAAHAESKGQPIGTVSALEGAALVTSDKADIGTPVHVNDLIETDDDARLQIEFVDGTELTLGEKAIVTIDEYTYSAADPEDSKAVFSVVRGAFYYASGLIAEQEHPKIFFETPYGSVGARGTKFWGGMLERSHVYGSADRMNGATKEFGVYAEKGEVVLKTNRGQSIIREGYGSFAQSIDSVPSGPKVWGNVDIGMALKQVSFAQENVLEEQAPAPLNE